MVVDDLDVLSKPDPDMFALALTRLGLLREQRVFIDDVARYLPPLRHCGMATIHATDPARHCRRTGAALR